MTTHTETKALVERLRELGEKASPGWEHVTEIVPGGVKGHIFDSLGHGVAMNLDADDAALIAELRNALSTILVALEAMAAPRGEVVERGDPELVKKIGDMIHDHTVFNMEWGPLGYDSIAKDVVRTVRAALPPCAECGEMREALKRISQCHFEYVEGVAVGEGPPVFSAEMMARIARSALAKKEPGHGG